jgi:hypothetical protein
VLTSVTCVFVIILALIGCGTPPGALRIELKAYVERSKEWAPIEADTARTLDRILQTQFVDEAEVLQQIADNRRRVRSHLEAVRGVVPASGRLRAIHERYIEIWETLLRGYEAIEQGFGSGDYIKLARGREAMTAWRDGIVRVARDLRDLMERYGVAADSLTKRRTARRTLVAVVERHGLHEPRRTRVTAGDAVIQRTARAAEVLLRERRAP